MEQRDRRQFHLLVLGSPRSGTTLLSAMLGCHPDIGILNEDYGCAEVKLFSKRVKGNKLCVPNQIELAYGRFSGVSKAVATAGQEIGDRVRSAFGLRTPIVNRDRSRLSIRDYERLRQNLHIIGIIRSPGDVIDSIGRRGQQSARTSVYRWRRAVEVLFELTANRAPGTGLTIVHYDRLIGASEDVMRQCLTELDCDYDPRVLDGFKYTPQYQGRSEIDRSKVSGGLEEDLQYALLQQDPALAQKYRSLFQLSI